jgi:hypothetical protein
MAGDALFDDGRFSLRPSSRHCADVSTTHFKLLGFNFQCEVVFLLLSLEKSHTPVFKQSPNKRLV